MSAVAASASATIGTLRRDVLVFTTYRSRMFMQLATGFVSVALFYYISRLVSVREFATADAYFAFVVVGIAIMEVVASTLNALPLRIRQELVAGTFERLVVSPFGPVGSIVSMALFPQLIAMVTACSSIAFAGIVFGMPLHWSTVPLAIPVAILAALAFMPFALLVSATVLAFKQAGTASGFVVTGLSFVGGFLFPISLLPGWIQWTSKVQPFTPALELLRRLLVDTPMTESATWATVKLALFATVLMPVGVWSLRLAVRYGQRKGTVTEY
jgi:ABC-2 type transport system permease protein